MEKNYNRMVIDLYKDYSLKHQVNQQKVMEVKEALAVGLTEARVKGCPTKDLELLTQDVEQLTQSVYEYAC